MKEKFKTLITRLIKNQLVRGSATLFLGDILANFGNYLYHLVMGRMLGPADYGGLESMISLIYILGIPLTTLNLVVIKTTSNLRGKKQEEKISFFYHHLNRQVFWWALAGSLLVLAISPLIKNFLYLGSVLPIGIIIGYSFVALFTGINLGILSGFLKFIQVSLARIFQSLIKLISAITLVGLGWSIFGASSSFLIGALLAFLFSLFSLKKILRKGQKNKNGTELAKAIKEVGPFFILTLSLTSLFTTDIILARHFLTAEEAGYYAALSVLGKIIYFASYPVTQVMFPMVTARHAAGADYRKLFFLSLFQVLMICGGIGVIYFLFPGLMVGFLFGTEYLVAAKYLGLFAVFLSFYCLASLISQFFLSLSKNKTIVLPLLAALAQIVLIVFWHQSLAQVILISTAVSGLLFVLLSLSLWRSAAVTSSNFLKRGIDF